MNELKVMWNKSSYSAPSYSEEELESIYKIKETHTLLSFRATLNWDLVLSLILASGFIALLQLAQLSSSNFWSFIMAFIALQHIILHRIQIKLITRRMALTSNVVESINSAIEQLTLLLWHYRVWPTLLGAFLYFGYIYWFSPNWEIGQIIIQAVTIVVVVGSISNILSAVMVRKQIIHLRRLSKSLLSE